MALYFLTAPVDIGAYLQSTRRRSDVIRITFESSTPRLNRLLMVEARIQIRQCVNLKILQGGKSCEFAFDNEIV